MENRITIKDLLVYLGLAIVSLLLILSMYMVDRQWAKLAQLESLIKEQAVDIRGLRTQLASVDRQLSSGVVSLVGAQKSTPLDQETSQLSRAEKVLANEDYAEGDWLVQAFALSLKTITPLISSDAYSSDVQS